MTHRKHLAIILGFAIAAMLPMYWYGLPSGNDQSQHYQFAWTVYNSLKAGDLYPSFAPDTNRGFGDYGIRFYPPLTYYVLAGLRALTGDWYVATLIALTLVFFIGALGIYVWTRDLFEERTALIAAALYTLIPYHLNEIYNNYLLAEFFATAVLPWCFVYLDKTMRGPSAKNMLPLAVSCSVLVLTHLPLTIIGGISMAFYAACLIKKDEAIRQIAWLLIAVILVAAMTAFYWSRWLPELNWITHNASKYFSTTWDYRRNFLLLPSHWTELGSDALNLWFGDLMLIAALLLAVPAVVIIIGDKDAWRTRLSLIVVLVLSLIMTTILGKPLWDFIAPLQKVQFPWRWLSIVSVFAAGLGADGIFRGLGSSRRRTGILVPGSLAVAFTGLAFLTVVIIRGPVYVTHAELNGEIGSFDNSTGCDCWWPIWANADAFALNDRIAAPGRETKIDEWSARTRSFTVAPGSPTTATLRAWYYPRWHVTINGVDAQPHVGADGALAIDLPADANNVSAHFVEPSYVIAAAYASLIAWMAVLFTTLALLIKSRRRTSASFRTS